MKIFEMSFTLEAEKQLLGLEGSSAYRAVARILALMQQDLKHPHLHTEECVSLTRERGYKICETHEVSQEPPEYHVLWYFSFKKNEITIIAIVPACN